MTNMVFLKTLGNSPCFQRHTFKIALNQAIGVTANAFSLNIYKYFTNGKKVIEKHVLLGIKTF